MAKLPEVKYGYASEVIPYLQGLLFGGDEGLTQAETAQNNQIWDRLGRGATASPNRMGPSQQAEQGPPIPNGLLSPSVPLPPRRPDFAPGAVGQFADPGAIENKLRASNTLNPAAADTAPPMAMPQQRNYGPMVTEMMPRIYGGPTATPPVRQPYNPTQAPLFSVSPLSLNTMWGPGSMFGARSRRG